MRFKCVCGEQFKTREEAQGHLNRLWESGAWNGHNQQDHMAYEDLECVEAAA